ncbi:uncharacterized protein VDAG_10241 [Verticillium dahliae VdLs.17]|uniref:Zn(2)-C6 fungal-type domain-containing protein n=2 Tax=Verticillium dahliae TaxID=27337 RepID=G2XJA9_VERDV|nr:uncharacterized protein VDAG_10241 [Verticillium dahliae VdLs.17]EGY20612.1 hypothetical protein VDAG_10241 [Verticillium dahliae VdLs.17]KAH6696382.1 fungal-specific transcription factor domain-containing protein [Verticillium dahliae]
MARTDAEGPPRVRSSTACLRCRRSKIKCDNTGQLDAACENCIKAGQRCQWPDPSVVPPKRTDAPSSIRQDSEPGRGRKRPRITPANAQSDGQQNAEDILSAPFLDRHVWDQILATYKLHFATELPFLHTPTLKDKIYQSRRDPATGSSELNLVLLGILALTARYHDELVKPAAAAASEFFADTLDKALGSCRLAMTRATVERVYALLLLGLYQWISRDHQGLGSWMYVGMAIRMAQALKIGVGDVAQSLSSSPFTEKTLIDREVRRRTMFSCFILDRILSCGKDRASCIRSEDLHIQLPCSEEDFDLTRQVYTGFLRGSLVSAAASRPDSPNILSSFVQLIDIWGEISHYSNAGGRFSEEQSVAPWEAQAKFSRLTRKLVDFNTNSRQGSSAFVSLHMLMCLSKIMLHREYIPFIPVRCGRPNGPLDEPTFAPDITPPGFWASSAKELFHAAAEICDLIEICGEKLPHSSLVVFAIWHAAYVGLYASHFPQMDVNRFKEADEFYARIIEDYNRNHDLNRALNTRQTGPRTRSVRMGGNGGSVEEWHKRKDYLTNNGSIIGDDCREHSRGLELDLTAAGATPAATDHYTRLDAELVADMEGKPFGFGYLNQNVFVGGFDEFSPGGWEAPSQEVARLLFPLTEDDA